MTVIEIDYDRMLSLLNDAIVEKGYGYADNSTVCRYVGVNNEPLCIVGRALVSAGVDPAVFRQCDSDGGSLNISSFSALHGHLEDFTFTPEAVSLANRVQIRQDIGLPWGECVATVVAGVEYIQGRIDV